MRKLLVASFISLATLSFNTLAVENLKLNTLEWPPYVSEKMPDQGFISKIVSMAFEKAGYTTTKNFLPWERAITQVIDEHSAAAYYPGYIEDCSSHKALASLPLGSGPLNFVQNKDKPVTWSELKDLADKKIGTVIGYVNTPDFDNMVSKQELKASPVKDDLTNMQKVESQRVDLAVIDGNLFQYTLGLHPEFTHLELNSKALSDVPLYICFQDNPGGKKLLENFNKALSTLDIKKIQKDYLDGLNKK